MKWTHKHIEIEVDDYGWFVFCFRGNIYKKGTLSEAKGKIDELTKAYYDFTNSDYNTMLSKLNERERDFVNTVCKELGQHEGNAYCERDVEIDFNFDFDKLLNSKTK